MTMDCHIPKMERIGSERKVVVNAHAAQSLTGRDIGKRVAVLVDRMDSLKKAIDKCKGDSPHRRDLKLKYKAAVIVVNDYGFDVFLNENDNGRFIEHIVRPREGHEHGV